MSKYYYEPRGVIGSYFYVVLKRRKWWFDKRITTVESRTQAEKIVRNLRIISNEKVSQRKEDKH